MKSKLVKKKKVYVLYDKELKSLVIKSSSKTITKRQNTHQQKKTEQNAGKVAHSAINRCVKSFFYAPNPLLTQGRRDLQ